MNKQPEVNYAEFVGNLCKPGSEILESLSPFNAHTIHMAMGVSGEAGELLDAVKKATIYRNPYDMNNIIEELGDIEFFLQGIRDAFGLDRQAILCANVAKLQKRYPNGYTNKAAQERADKS